MMFGKKPGFCELCGGPNEFVPVCYQDAPYSNKTGQISTFSQRPACLNPDCNNHKLRREWVFYDVASVFTLIWTGRVPPSRPAGPR
jgi:hypothetical protein